MKIDRTNEQCLRSIVDSNCVKRTEKGKTQGGKKTESVSWMSIRVHEGDEAGH